MNVILTSFIRSLGLMESSLFPVEAKVAGP